MRIRFSQSSALHPPTARISFNLFLFQVYDFSLGHCPSRYHPHGRWRLAVAKPSLASKLMWVFSVRFPALCCCSVRRVFDSLGFGLVLIPVVIAVTSWIVGSFVKSMLLRLCRFVFLIPHRGTPRTHSARIFQKYAHQFVSNVGTRWSALLARQCPPCLQLMPCQGLPAPCVWPRRLSADRGR